MVACTNIYIYICMYVCVCVCVCECFENLFCTTRGANVLLAAVCQLVNFAVNKQYRNISSLYVAIFD